MRRTYKGIGIEIAELFVVSYECVWRVNCYNVRYATLKPGAERIGGGECSLWRARKRCRI